MNAAEDDSGSKWSLRALWRRLQQSHGAGAVAEIQQRIEQLVVLTMLAVQSEVVSACKAVNCHNDAAFELFGFDVLIDSQLKPW